MPFGKQQVRQRLPLAVALLMVVATGLASRSLPFVFPAMLGKYPGDTLWAIMILLGIALLRPGIPPARLSLLALTIAYLVELSQIYQAPWINAIRATRAGHLILGSTFDWLDLCAYTIGIIIGFILDVSLFHRALVVKK